LIFIDLLLTSSLFLRLIIKSLPWDPNHLTIVILIIFAAIVVFHLFGLYFIKIFLLISVPSRGVNHIRYFLFYLDSLLITLIEKIFVQSILVLYGRGIQRLRYRGRNFIKRTSFLCSVEILVITLAGE